MHWLEECLAGILAQETGGDFEFEVLVIDNGSTDGTSRLLTRLAGEEPRLRWFTEPVRSESRARNVGIRESRGSWLAFVDDDELVDPFWLRHLLLTARREKVAIVGGAVRLSASAQYQYHPWTRGLFGELAQSCSGPYPPRVLPGTGNVLVHWSVVERVGGFDQQLTLASDTDFFHRAIGCGFSTWFCNEARVLHRVTEAELSLASLRKRAIWQGESFAKIHYEVRGSGLAMGALARLFYTCFRHVGGLWLGHILRDDVTRIGHLTRIWRFQGFVKGALCLTFAKPGAKDIPRYRRSIKRGEGYQIT